MTTPKVPLQGAVATMTIGRADGSTEKVEVPMQQPNPKPVYSNPFTAKYYQDQFSDILADVQADDPKIVDKLFEGFIMAIDGWINYHDAQADSYISFKKRLTRLTEAYQ